MGQSSAAPRSTRHGPSLRPSPADAAGTAQPTSRSQQPAASQPADIAAAAQQQPPIAVAAARHRSGPARARTTPLHPPRRRCRPPRAISPPALRCSPSPSTFFIDASLALHPSFCARRSPSRRCRRTGTTSPIRRTRTAAAECTMRPRRTRPTSVRSVSRSWCDKQHQTCRRTPSGAS